MGKVLLPMILPKAFHLPVLLPEVTSGLNIKKGGKYIDATLGGGGYTFEIVKRGGVVLGIDMDPAAIEYVEEILRTQNLEQRNVECILLEKGNFRDLKKIAEKHKFEKIDGIVFDLGMSSFQIEDSGRGFSYQRKEFLDMRMDDTDGIRAYDIVNKYSREKLYEIFTKNAEELHSGAIVSAVIRSRTLKGPIESTEQLGGIIEEAMKSEMSGKNSFEYQNEINRTKARIFQALRIAVNNELENLKTAIYDAVEILEPCGRLVILSYHSLEDRTVKTILKENMRENKIKIISKKPIVADEYERMNNTKSRSAKLRIAQKV